MPGSAASTCGGSARTAVDNPSCAYDPAWACPLAPEGNVIAARVDAGELAPAPAH
jgi:uncharacterized protein (DUF1684 family)